MSFAFTGASTDEMIGSSFLLAPQVIQNLDPVYVATGDYCEVDIGITANAGAIGAGVDSPARLYIHLDSPTSTWTAFGNDDRWTSIVTCTIGGSAIDNVGEHINLHSLIGPVGIATVYTPQLMCVVPTGDNPIIFYGPWNGITKIIRGGP